MQRFSLEPCKQQLLTALSLQLWTARWQPVWVMPEMRWPTLPLTRWRRTDSLCWPSSSPACCPRPASDSSPSSSLPCSNRLVSSFWILCCKPHYRVFTDPVLCASCRNPSGQAPAPSWMTGCLPCVSWSTSRWPTPCWWSILLCTVSTIWLMRWGGWNFPSVPSDFCK